MQQGTRSYAAASSTLLLSALALASPVIGLFLELILAWRFGASGTVDAFRIASLLLVFGRQISFGQILPHVVVPMYMRNRVDNREEDAWRLCLTIAWLLTIAAGAFTAWIWIAPWQLTDMLGPGLAGAARSDAFVMLRYFSLSLVVMVWSGVMGGVLYANRIFWLVPASQLLTNILLIAAVVSVGRFSSSHSLSLGVLAGSILSLVLHVTLLKRLFINAGLNLRRVLKPGPRQGLLSALRMAAPLTAMVFIGQWGVIIVNRTLTQMPTGTLAVYGYAFKLILLANIVPNNLATVLFPEFSEAAAGSEHERFKRIATRATRMMLFLTIPLCGMLFILADPLIRLLFSAGAMDEQALRDTVVFYGIFLVSVPPAVLTQLSYKVSFARHNSETPMLATLITAVLLTLTVPWSAKAAGATGVAWANSLVTLAVCIGLITFQVRKYRTLDIKEMVVYFLRVNVLGIITALSAFAALELLPDAPQDVSALISKAYYLGQLIISGLFTVGALLFASRLLQIPECAQLKSFIVLRFVSFFNK